MRSHPSLSLSSSAFIVGLSLHLCSPVTADTGWGTVPGAHRRVEMLEKPVDEAPAGVKVPSPFSGRVEVSGYFNGLGLEWLSKLPQTLLGGVKEIAVGSRHLVALKEDGSLVTWGQPTITPSPGLTGLTSVAAGSQFSLAVTADGSVLAGGKMLDGGNRFLDFTYSPVVVPTNLTAVRAIAASDEHIVALRENGTLAEWGWVLTQCGQNGIAYQPAVIPPALRSVNCVAIDAGSNHGLALTSAGEVLAWGVYYQCTTDNGNGESIPAVAPPVVKMGVTAIAAGELHSLALKADGSLVEWGVVVVEEQPIPPFGYVYRTAKPFTRLLPTAEFGTDLRVTAITAGNLQSAALLSDGTVLKWYWSNQPRPYLERAQFLGSPRAILVRDYVTMGIVDPGPPDVLHVTQYGTGLLLWWPENDVSYHLQASLKSDLSGPWVSVVGAPGYVNGYRSLKVPVTGFGRYYRLKAP